SLDAPILSHGTNQARRGSDKRPTRQGWGRRAGTCHDAHGGRGRVMNKREATLNERTRMYSRHTQRSAFPLRSPSFGAGQCLEPLTGKQAHWRARPPILRTQSRSKRGKGKQGGIAHLRSPVQSAQPHHAVAQAVRWGVVCWTLVSNDVMAITKPSISGSEKSVPKHQQSKRLRCAAIVFSYRHYVAAYPPGRVHRAVPSKQKPINCPQSGITASLVRSGRA